MGTVRVTNEPNTSSLCASCSNTYCYLLNTDKRVLVCPLYI